MHEIPITENEAGMRLDRYLRKLLRTVPLAAIFRQVRQGDFKVDGKRVEPHLRLAAGMKVQLKLRPADIEALRAAAPRPRPRAAVGPGQTTASMPRVVYQDEQVLVVCKPAGLAVHAGSGQRDTLVTWIASQRVGVRTATFAPAPAHRLDRGTSGLLAIGLTPDALRALTAAFRANQVQKVYAAVVHGEMEREHGSVVAPLWQDASADSRDAKVRVDPRGSPARTDYEVLKRGRHMTLLRVVPYSGRQHQIRAHLAHMGHAIVGDHRYGSVADVGPGFLLHATDLTFPHPRTGKPLHCSDPVPADFSRLLDPE
ncbi:MAG TPA: RluA family pseudouridine synthase [Planctomycetota bacterium]|nr:RluA family pseudouridine synthase [Planctomycetota bacterium]